MSLTRQTISVDLVIPVYNEAGVVEQTFKSLCAVIDVLPYAFTIYYVDDGSTDDTVAALKALGDPRVHLLEFSRNFGHQAALTAGMDTGKGDIVVTMDADGQHPPEMIPQMIDLVLNGYDIVHMQRIENTQEHTFKKSTSGIFYRLLNRFSGTHVQPGVADFRALSREALDALKSMPEFHRFLRGMIAWMGFRSVILPYQEPRRIAGKSKYSLGKMVRLASDAIFSFSLVPLYIGLSMGGIFMLLALAQIIYVLGFWFTGNSDKLEPGWSSLLFFLLIASGTIMISLGFIGVYVGYIFQEVKRRPIYIIKKGDEQTDA